jgi:GNAT superfamily N-acetyltransferase
MRDRAGAKRIPTVVTFLDMKSRPEIVPPPIPGGKIAILRAAVPPVHFYRYLYDIIGRAHYWVDRKKLSDGELGALLRDPELCLYVLYVDGSPAGIAEFDFRAMPTGQLAYFGLVPDYIGRGLGHYFLFQSVILAWDRPITRLKVNTCTLDHPRALPLYQRAGFNPYAREERFILLP